MPVLRGAPFIPTTSRSGNESPAIFRAKNMLLRGKRADRLYLEVYSGIRRVTASHAPSPVTGGVSYSGGRLLTGDSITGQFLSELRPGQMLLIGNEVAVVDLVFTNTSCSIVGQLSSPFSGPADRLPVLFEVNDKRGSLISGNAVEFDKGTILVVGDGGSAFEGLRLDGMPTAPTVNVTRTPKILIPSLPIPGFYNNYDLGMATPAAPGAAGVAGGVKNMQPGLYSVRIAPARVATGGFNNPSPKTEVTIAAGQKIRITFPAMDIAKGQDAWRIYGTLYTANQGVQGPWYFVQTVTATQLGGTGAGTTFDVEWLDGEISRNELLEFDNFAPPECDFIATLGGNPVYISCFGKSGGSPGPNIVPAKPRNIEGAMVNLNLRLDPAHTIIGYREAQGRLFLMTNNSLQIATLSNLPFAPITTRPFWKRGFHNPYSLIFVNGRLYGWTHNGPTRSAMDGEEGSEEFAFGADVKEITQNWNDGKVFVAHSPPDEVVCYIHSADSLNAQGWWETLILPYSLPHEMWMPPIVLTSPTQDMIVSGVATVKNRLYLLAGGRRQNESLLFFDEYEFNSVDAFQPNTVPYFAAWQYSDGDAEDRAKRITAFRVTGRFQSGKFAVYGEDEDGEIQSEPFEDPAKSLSGDIDITTGAELRRGERQELNLPEVNLWTARISGQWTGTSETPKDRIDEVHVEASVRKMRR